MHLPDPFLSGKTLAATGALSAVGLTVAVRQANRHLPRSKVPLMGLSAAFIFAAQMINFPVLGGTSGHLIGGTLAAILLGPEAAIIVLSSVLIVQCFLCGDGGVLALGANIFNMAIVDSLTGYYAYRLVRYLIPSERGRLTAVAFAAWLATVLSAAVCAGELASSGYVKFAVALPAMVNIHMLIGIGEALLTTLIVSGIARTRSDLIREPVLATAAPRAYLAPVVYGLLISLGIALFLSPLASSAPDGLEWVAGRLGIQDTGATLINAPLAEYKIPWLHTSVLATSLAGAIGTIVAFGLSLLLAGVLVRRSAAVSPVASPSV